MQWLGSAPAPSHSQCCFSSARRPVCEALNEQLENSAQDARTILVANTGPVTSLESTLVQNKDEETQKYEREQKIPFTFSLHKVRHTLFKTQNLGASPFWTDDSSLTMWQQGNWKENELSVKQTRAPAQLCHLLVCVVLEHYFAHLENGVMCARQGCSNSFKQKGALAAVRLAWHLSGSCESQVNSCPCPCPRDHWIISEDNARCLYHLAHVTVNCLHPLYTCAVPDLGAQFILKQFWL